MNRNNNLYRIYKYCEFLSSLLTIKSQNYFLNKSFESIMEDFQLESYLNNEWGDNLLSVELFKEFKILYDRIISLYDSLKEAENYNVDYLQFFNHEKLSGILIEISQLIPKIEEELAVNYNYNLSLGIYLDGSTFNDHLNDDPKPDVNNSENRD